jgi:hypothetical protein
MIIRFIQLVLVAVAFTMLSPAPSSAQMGTQPFSFGSGGSGLGISEAGKAAIINQKVLGLTPPVLLKDEFGRPLGVVQGPGGIPVVTGPAGELLPGYRGRGWKHSNAVAAGVFNEFFVTGPKSNAPYIAGSTSGQMVDAWTDAVYGAPAGYGNSVDQWTAMAHYLGAR